MSFSKRKKLIGLVVMPSLPGGVATVTATNVGPQGDCGDGTCCVCYANNIYAPPTSRFRLKHINRRY